MEKNFAFAQKKVEPFCSPPGYTLLGSEQRLYVNPWVFKFFAIWETCGEKTFRDEMHRIPHCLLPQGNRLRRREEKSNLKKNKSIQHWGSDGGEVRGRGFSCHSFPERPRGVTLQQCKTMSLSSTNRPSHSFILSLYSLSFITLFKFLSRISSVRNNKPHLLDFWCCKCYANPSLRDGRLQGGVGEGGYTAEQLGTRQLGAAQAEADSWWPCTAAAIISPWFCSYFCSVSSINTFLCVGHIPGLSWRKCT